MWGYPVQQLQNALSYPDLGVGYGTGVASLGAQYVARIMGVPPSEVGVESGYGNVLLELGILGLILFLLWTSNLIAACFMVALRLKGTWGFPLAISIGLFSFFLLFLTMWGTIVVYEDFVNNAYFWFLMGVLFRLPGLVREDAEQQLAAVTARDGRGERLAQLSHVG
jgi:hypothetical protein